MDLRRSRMGAGERRAEAGSNANERVRNSCSG
jgi:hypothetical protein